MMDIGEKNDTGVTALKLGLSDSRISEPSTISPCCCWVICTAP